MEEETNNFERSFKGVWIDKSIWLNKDLTAIDKVIFAEISSLDNNEKGCYASNKYLADFCQCSENKVSLAIKKLIKLDLIEVISFDGRHRFIKVKSQPFKNTKSDIENVKPNNINNNIDNNNDINNINIINIENLPKNNENTNIDNTKNNNIQIKPISNLEINKILEKSILDKNKEKRKSDKIKKFILMNQMLDNFTQDEDIKSQLQIYLDIRKKKNLTPEQWKIILDDFRKECGNDKQYALEKLRKAIAGGWMQIVYIKNGNNTHSYGTYKPSFDNTANHNVPKGVASMNEAELYTFKQTLAVDSSGNYIKF